ncbi:MAG: HK97 gp10 family phage protein [Culicoidibacterales bacterium]
MSGIRNLNAIRRALTSDVPKLIEQAAKEAIVDTMIWGQKEAKENLRKSYSTSPQAVRKRTGALARSISIDRSQLNQLKGRLYSNMEYAPHVEYGHILVRGGKTVGYIEGKHFMEDTGKKLPNILNRNVAKSLGRRL